jgi:hypothetical protein
VPDHNPDTLEHTEPHHAPIFDTGPHPSPLKPLVADPEPSTPHPSQPNAISEADSAAFGQWPPPDELKSEPIVTPAQPVVVPGSCQYLKWWQLVAIVAGMWVVAAAIGLGLYYWWFQSINKTPTVFVVLMYLMVVMVTSLLVSMVPNKPLISALALALMSAPLASTAAAAVLYGAYYFEWIARPTIG